MKVSFYCVSNMLVIQSWRKIFIFYITNQNLSIIDKLDCYMFILMYLKACEMLLFGSFQESQFLPILRNI